MKTYFTKMSIIIALLFITTNSFSQNPTLTKGETISYINKKLKEAIGKSLRWNGDTYTYTNVSLTAEDENTLTIIIEMDNDEMIPAKKYSFTPKDISLYEISNASDTAGQFTLYAKNSIDHFKDRKGRLSDISTQSFEVPYSKDNPENFNKIEKAFKYLESISKEVKDPFGK